ncbi:hypothetical protein ACWT_1106 [Actinoplanes sp. SE50]|uniref:hypothetical protein n=1 Tax=unclassified Actinoplanes TaxID=2626549 RepID=UPI00023ECE02|nr:MULTISPECIES: hypothetical protein [unclassified Actinoplanes]AEV82122.1 hypothetical protein ACPL_1225 [Actinoplanes sp. SE50/110]ATO80521.1 hypothetical protein ACWT_1106 [Actinoplanes sp. SE50]SLL97927.1 hypothetical protein ACSP50_1143 [Actinoplanes sp. SE50/110]
MLIKVIDQITDGEMLEAAWGLYLEAFEDLNSLAVQRHLMYRSEFDEVMRDPRVDKYLALQEDGTLAGLSCYTNNLDAIPLIAPAYFERHYPEHYHAKRIWYIVFVAVKPEAQGQDAFAQMSEQMYLVAATQNGLVGLDVCSYNDDVRHMSRVFRLLIGRLCNFNMTFQQIDQQSFWLYNFPAVASENTVDIPRAA